MNDNLNPWEIEVTEKEWEQGLLGVYKRKIKVKPNKNPKQKEHNWVVNDGMGTLYFKTKKSVRKHFGV